MNHTIVVTSFGQRFMFRSAAFVLFCALLIDNISAATIVVGPPPASIQTAINGASSGDTIQLSAGTYVQEVQVISKSLTILGVGENSTIIQAPGPTTRLTQFFTFSGINYWCIVMVDNQAAPTPQTVTISDLTVDGDDQQDTIVPPIYGNSDRFFAIGYHNANGTVQNVHTTNTRQLVNFNELAGGGIINASDTGSVIFTVTNCLIDFYQRIGIDCRGSALTATISNNTVNRGYVLTPNTITATPNGIQFSLSATGTITNNLVESNIATVLGASATGILPFGAGANVIVSGNTVNNNDNGIAAVSNGNNLIISNNTLNFTTTPGVNPAEGIIVQDTAGLTTITANVMNNIPNVNMEILSSTNQPYQLMNNQFIGSQAGLIVTGSGAMGPVITMNSDVFTGTTGFYIREVAAPNDIWPSTATVSFDGLVSGHMTFAQFNQVLTKIFDKHNDPALGLVLAFIPQTPFVLTPTACSVQLSPVVFSGTADPGATIIITINNQVFTTTASATGFWSMSITLANGNYTATVQEFFDTTLSAIASVSFFVRTSFSPLVQATLARYCCK